MGFKKNKLNSIFERMQSYRVNELCYSATLNIYEVTHMASRKSSLVNICPNSYEKLTKSVIKPNWNWFEHCSKSLSSRPLEVMSGHYSSQFTGKVDQNYNFRSNSSWFEFCTKSVILTPGSHVGSLLAAIM